MTTKKPTKEQEEEALHIAVQSAAIMVLLGEHSPRRIGALLVDMTAKWAMTIDPRDRLAALHHHQGTIFRMLSEMEGSEAKAEQQPEPPK